MTPTDRLHEWGQTIVVLLTIFGACVSGVLWVERSDSALGKVLLELKSTHALDQAAIESRLTLSGWSRQQQQAFVDDLRAVADHPVPSLE